MQHTETRGLNTSQIHSFRRKLMVWYRGNARELPWRGTQNPYETWVSEVMLQQTRVNAVLEHYERFLRLFPTVVALALASESDVLAAWSGLGYYRRARSLHQAAQFLVRERAARIPTTAAELRTLPGIGEYTCAAIASIAFGESAAVLDGNVERVLLRLTGRPQDNSATVRTFLREQADALIPHKRMGDDTNAAGDHNQAMMELGATLCLPRAPLCLHCPVYDLCETRGEHLTGPRPKQRSQSVAYLLATRKLGARTEVLLTRRAADASLMPGMLELPPLAVGSMAVPSELPEPILRLRHAITNTNFYVEVYAQSGDLGGKQPAPWKSNAKRARKGTGGTDRVDDDFSSGEQTAFQQGETRSGLLAAVPIAVERMTWFSLTQLAAQPLTGLTRKILMRVDLFSVTSPETPSRSSAAQAKSIQPRGAPATAFSRSQRS